MNATIKKENSEKNTMCISEKWSLCMDGELSEQEVDELLAQYAQEKTIVKDWQTYHIIGDVLRSSDLALSHAILASGGSRIAELSKRLAQEPLIMAPVKLPRSKFGKKVLGLRWPHWTGLFAASGFAVIAFVAVVNTAQEDALFSGEQHNMAVTDIASKATSTSQFITIAKQYITANLPTQTSLRESRSSSRPNIRFVSAASNRMQESAVLVPYLSAHQQFSYGSTLGNADLGQSIIQTSANDR